MATAVRPGPATTRRPVQTGRASALRVVRVIWLREVLVYWRDKMRVVSALIMPILLLVIFGEGLGNSIGALAPGIDYRQFIFPGMVAMTVLMTSVFSGVSIIWDRQFGFLREMLVAPISRTAIAAGKVLGGATIAVFQGIVMFVFAPVLGVSLSLVVMLKLIGILAVMAVTMTSAGIALGSRLKSVESFQMVSNLTIMPAMFLSGIFFPVNNVPTWMEVLVKLNPVTYAVAPIRSVALQDTGGDFAMQVAGVELFGRTITTMESLALLLVFGVLILSVAVLSFRARD